MHIQDSQWTAAAGSEGAVGGARPAPLRVDAQRNLEHVLRAAREVFGESGYGAPMEDVARRARVGVGTVYRRFPSKDVLVRRIAEEETARLTEQARTALGQENEAWSALARFLRTSVASGAGRLLPPQVLRVQSPAAGTEHGGASPLAGEANRVPQQRSPFAASGGLPVTQGGTEGQAPSGASAASSASSASSASGASAASVAPETDTDTDARTVPAAGTAPGGAGVSGVIGDTSRRADHAGRDDIGSGSDGGTDRDSDQDGIRTLLDVVGRLVDRAREAGELRGDVSVADVLLVIATSAPSLPDPAQQAAASARLLDILLEGLRSRPAERAADTTG
ncbi:transcriptional regulator, TetR family [Actinacidiphila alni]|uniref:Transcriptional regulator, TetR family n=1 Tax=Actinacidiphila alni TaxID=380248 RepID=A0A1I2KX48_9ACTN|nr:helix-turn-helix domain-containing protein [Actinacidiphila alni]SFF71652.1 transcriptional regulator, TetR family [Actinacidiphila alni]